MKKLSAIIILLVSIKSFAQKNNDLAVPDTLYFKKYYESSNLHQAEIIRIIYDVDPNYHGYVFKEFDIHGKLEKSGIITKKTGKPTGMITDYHENGIKKSEGKLDNIRKGIWKEWYQNGALKSETDYIYNDKGQSFTKLINYNDSIGNLLVINGNGIYKQYYKNDINGQLKETGLYKDHNRVGVWEGFRINGFTYFKENYSDEGELINGVSYDSLENFYEYTELGISPSPKNGLEGFYKNIGQSIEYPKSARRQGIQGKVYIQFVVDKDGSLIEVKTVKGISKECDEEAERVVKKSEIWTPGFQRGQPVKVRMIIPITFKLT